MLHRLLAALCLITLSVPASAVAADSGHYLFVWTGDQAKQGNDFLSVIDADPGSPRYGKLVTTVATVDGQGFSATRRFAAMMARSGSVSPSGAGLMAGPGRRSRTGRFSRAEAWPWHGGVAGTGEWKISHEAPL